MGADGRRLRRPGVAIFFRALSAGKMGVTAPVAAVLGAAIPTLFSIFTEGLPGKVPILGFAVAVIGLAHHAHR